MTMHIVYKQFHDGHNAGDAAFTERSLARRLCSEGKAVPYVDFLKEQAKEKELKAKADKKAEKVKAKVEEPKEEKSAKEEKKKPKRKYTKPEKAVTIKK